MSDKTEFIPSSPGDWPEDWEHENGTYRNQCCVCFEFFTGHKRRELCKRCAKPSLRAAAEKAVELITKSEDTGWVVCASDAKRILMEALARETEREGL